jgi:ABC-2 type transport system ATP-binding protein
MMNHLLSVEQVHKNYGSYAALQDVSIQVPKGSVYGLLGPNGAGKTSLIRIINQITAPDSGRILLDGRPLKPSDVQKIGYLPEERGLYRKMEVGEQALYLAQLKGLSKSDAKKKLKYWFEKFEIESWWHKKVEELSKGMAQKVQFIVTVLHEPELLIFDEPFTGFDPINTNLIKSEIKSLNQKGATIIFSTHRMESVEEVCQYIALINKSKKILEGPLTEIRQAYSTQTWRIGFQNLPESLSDLPETIKVKRNEEKNHIDFELQNVWNPNQLLSYLLAKSNIQSMEEIIPSVNDIFIQKVGAHHE